MVSLGSLAWPLGFLAILAGGYLLFLKAGIAPWFSIILVGAGLLMFVGFAMTVSSTRDDNAAFQPAKQHGEAANDDGSDDASP